MVHVRPPGRWSRTVGHAGELKTKPTQHSVNELRRIGIQPHALVCRSRVGLDRDIRRKIALRQPPEDGVISARDVDNTYKVPLVFRAEGIDDQVLDYLGIDAPAPDLSEWEQLVRRADAATRKVRSRWSASTSSSRTPTSLSSRRCDMAATTTAPTSRSRW